MCAAARVLMISCQRVLQQLPCIIAMHWLWFRGVDVVQRHVTYVVDPVCEGVHAGMSFLDARAMCCQQVLIHAAHAALRMGLNSCQQVLQLCGRRGAQALTLDVCPVTDLYR